MPDLTPEQIAETKAYMHNMGMMHQIVRNMREVPELPSEKPTDVHPLVKVEFPEGGGVLTYMEGYEHPYKGFPMAEFVDKIDAIKKTLRNTLSSFYHALKRRPKYQLFFLITVPWLFSDFIKALIYNFYRQVDRFKVKPALYSTAIRELHRAMSLERQETPEETEMRHMVRDIVCMLLEFDNAYRFRFQDIAPELNREALIQHPTRELIRLFSLMQSREVTQEIKDTWTLLKFFLPWYLRFNPRLRSALVETLLALDPSKVVLSVEDQVYARPRKDYQFAFPQ